MLQIKVKGGNGRYQPLLNGPFDITREELDAAREAYSAALRELRKRSSGIQESAPATMARELLEKHAPRLSNFDRLCVAYAVTFPAVRTEEVNA